MHQPPNRRQSLWATPQPLPRAITRRHAPTPHRKQRKGPRFSRRWFLKRFPGGRNGFDRGLRAFSEGGKVTHLSARSRVMLAVKMQMNVVDAESGHPIWFAVSPNITQQVRHGGGTNQIRRAQRQSTNRTHMLFELAGRAAFDRPMP